MLKHLAHRSAAVPVNDFLTQSLIEAVLAVGPEVCRMRYSMKPFPSKFGSHHCHIFSRSLDPRSNHQRRASHSWEMIGTQVFETQVSQSASHEDSDSAGVLAIAA